MSFRIMPFVNIYFKPWFFLNTRMFQNISNRMKNHEKLVAEIGKLF